MKQKPDFEYEGIKILIGLVDKPGRRLKRMSEEAGVSGTPFSLLMEKNYAGTENLLSLSC